MFDIKHTIGSFDNYDRHKVEASISCSGLGDASFKAVVYARASRKSEVIELVLKEIDAMIEMLKKGKQDFEGM